MAEPMQGVEATSGVAQAEVERLRAQMAALQEQLAAAEATAEEASSAALRREHDEATDGTFLDDAACARTQAEHIYHALSLPTKRAVRDYWRGVLAAARAGRASVEESYSWCEWWLVAADKECAAEALGDLNASAVAARGRGDWPAAVDDRRALVDAVGALDGRAADDATRAAWAAFAKEELGLALWDAGRHDEALAEIQGLGYWRYAILSDLVTREPSRVEAHAQRVNCVRAARDAARREGGAEEPAPEPPFETAAREREAGWSDADNYTRVLSEAAAAWSSVEGGRGAAAVFAAEASTVVHFGRGRFKGGPSSATDVPPRRAPPRPPAGQPASANPHRRPPRPSAPAPAQEASGAGLGGGAEDEDDY